MRIPSNQNPTHIALISEPLRNLDYTMITKYGSSACLGPVWTGDKMGQIADKTQENNKDWQMRSLG